MEINWSEKSILRITVGIYFFIFLIKILAFFVTNMLVLLAEAFHTLTDLALSGFLYLSAIWSQKKADKTHIFGYDRVQFIGALVAATLFLSITSLRLLEEAIPKILSTEQTTINEPLIGLVIIIISSVLSLIPLLLLRFSNRQTATLKAQTLELINDQLGLIAAFLGIILTLSGISVADAIATIAVAGIIGLNSIKLFKENSCYLIGKSADKEYIDKIITIVKNVDGIIDIKDLRTEHLGPNLIHSDFSIVVKKGLVIEKVEEIQKQVKLDLEQHLGCKYCTINVITS